MGIDISKLEGNLQNLAKLADKNNNGVIDAGKEETIFNSYAKTAVENKEVKEADYKEIFGSTIKSSTTTATIPNQDSKKDIERKQDYILRTLESAIKENPDNILKTLKEKLGNSANNGTYLALQEKVEIILDSIKDSKYKSKDDIDDLEKNVKKELDINRKDKFDKKVLDLLIKVAENDQRNKEYAEIAASYNAKVKAGMDEELAYNDVKKEFKKKGSYYKDGLKTLEDDIMTNQRQVVMDAVLDSEATKSRKVKKDAKETLKENEDWNKYTKKALKGERTFTEKMHAENSDMKNLRKTQATKNKVTEIQQTPQTKESILKAIGKKHAEVFEALVASGLIEKQEDGLYSLKPLSELIGDYVGADYKLNKQSNVFKALAEKTKTTSGLSAATQLDTLDEGEAKDLVKLCGYKVEGANLGKAILGATVGALVGAASGIAGRAENVEVTNKAHTEVNIDCEQSIAEQIKKDFDKNKQNGAEVKVISTGLQVLIDIKNIIPVLWHTSNTLVRAAIRGSMVGAAAGFIMGLADKAETPITSTQFDCTTLEEYKKVLDNETKQKAVSPKYAEALMLIAGTFEKDGKWDCDGYKAFLNHAAGNGGVLNRAELIAALAELKKNPKTEPAKPEVETTPEVTPEPETTPEKSCNVLVNKDTKDTTFIHERKGGDTWKGIIEAYYPELADKFGLWGKDGAIRKLKEALSYNADGTFNKETYTKLLNGGDLPKEMLLPAEIDGVKRVDTGKVKADEVKGNGKALINKVGNPSGETTYIAQDGCDESITATGKTKEEAIKALEEKTGRDYNETIENYEN